MGEGAQAPLGRHSRPPPQPEPRAAVRRSHGPAQGPEPLRAQSQPRAGQRAARARPAPTLPPPAARRSPCQAEAGEARPAPRQVLRPRAPALRPRLPALCCPPQLRGAGAARAEVLRASPIRPAASSFAYSRHPPPARRSDTRARDSRRGGPRRSFPPPRVRRPRQHLSPRPAPGRVGLGWGPTAPPPQRPTQPWGRGPPPSSPGPVPAPRLGRVPAPNTLRKPGKKCPPARPGPAPRAPHPREPAPGLASGCRSPQPSGRRPGRRGEEEGSRSARHDRGPPARSLTCQLSSQ